MRANDNPANEAMFFFFHLLIGFVIGLFLADLLHDRRWVIPCAIGAAIPDLIDKPLGYVVFSASINNGRIYFHTLLLLILVFAAGVILLKYRESPLGVSAALGMLSHQMLDFMWTQPATWFYPLLGPFPRAPHTGNVFTLLMSELTNPFEWFMLGIVAIMFYLYLKWDQNTRDEEQFHRVVRTVLALVVFTIVVLFISFLLWHIVE